jgi:Putative antitoxin of bacterial toxin-antitoxin system, YdaS/YdaT
MIDLAMAERIKEAIAACDSRKVVAEACGVRPNALIGWMKTGQIAKEHLPRLAKLSGFSVQWLMLGTGEKKMATESSNDTQQQPKLTRVSATCRLPYAITDTLEEVASLADRAPPNMKDDVLNMVVLHAKEKDPTNKAKIAKAIEALTVPSELQKPDKAGS